MQLELRDYLSLPLAGFLTTPSRGWWNIDQSYELSMRLKL
jgi:hypothetical protein